MDTHLLDIFSTKVGSGPFLLLVTLSLHTGGKYKVVATGGSEITNQEFDLYTDAKALYDKCIAIAAMQFKTATGVEF